MAGRGTDIILGGNSDYMARLKLKETLMPLLVKPENEHKPPIPQQRAAKSVEGFSSKSKNRSTLGSNNNLNNFKNLFPCQLDENTKNELDLLSKRLVESWGERNLSNIELEDKIATAAEKAPTEDNLIQSLREVLSNIKREYETVLMLEEEMSELQEVYMLLVLKDMNQEEWIINLEVELEGRVILEAQDSFYLWKIIY